MFITLKVGMESQSSGMKNINKNYYDILEIYPNATPEEVDQAYNRVKKAFTKDSLASDSHVENEKRQAILKQVEEAYQILRDEGKRQQYDKTSHEEPIQLKMNLEDAPEEKMTPEKPPAKVKVIETNPELEKEVTTAEHFTGEFLKKVRLSRNVSLEEISNATRISVRYLTALEEEQMEVFPALVYLKGFLTQYARYLGLDPAKVVSGYVKLKTTPTE